MYSSTVYPVNQNDEETSVSHNNINPPETNTEPSNISRANNTSTTKRSPHSVSKTSRGRTTSSRLSSINKSMKRSASLQMIDETTSKGTVVNFPGSNSFQSRMISEVDNTNNNNNSINNLTPRSPSG